MARLFYVNKSQLMIDKICMKKIILYLSLVSNLALADICSNIFITEEAFKNRIQTLELGPLGELEDLLLKLPRRRQAMLLDFSENFSREDMRRAVQLYQDSPEVFKRIDDFDELRFFNEISNPGYAERSFSRAAGQTNDYSWRMPDFVDASEASAIDKKYRDALVEVRNFLDDEAQVFKRMQEFEDDIMARSRLESPNFEYLSAQEQAIIKQNNMERILGEYEEAHGFQSAVKGEYKAIDLENKSYSMDDWFEMLRDGRQFNDTAFKQAQDATGISESMRNGHGYYTHRIQWHILMKEMDAAPSRFGELRGVELFKKLGDNDFGKKLGMNGNSGDTLWQHLFDALNTGTYHCPEYFRKTHTLYPEIGAWL